MVYKNFELEYSYLVDQVVDYCSSGPFELTINLDDGREIIYDGLLHLVTEIHKKDENGDPIALTDEEWSREFARRLQRTMGIAGYNQLKLSEATGISRQTMCKYLNGRVLPSILNIKKIAQVIKCSVDYLINFE